MTDAERIVKAITTLGDKINKTLAEGFRAANINFADQANSLRILAEKSEIKEDHEDD